MTTRARAVTTRARAQPLGAKQRGIVLFVSLALLLALAVGGVAVAQIATLELRMARNYQDAALAFHAAEAALLEAETWLAVNAGDPPALFAMDGNGLFGAVPYGLQLPWQRAGVWTDSRSQPVANALPHVTAQPRYIVEWLATLALPAAGGTPAATIDIFRITARGQGVLAAATLQSTYGRSRGAGGANAHPMTGRLSWIDLGA